MEVGVYLALAAALFTFGVVPTLTFEVGLDVLAGVRLGLADFAGALETSSVCCKIYFKCALRRV